MLNILSRSSFVTSFLNRFKFVNTFPVPVVKVHKKLISSKMMDGLIVFSNAKLISIGSVHLKRHRIKLH